MNHYGENDLPIMKGYKMEGNTILRVYEDVVTMYLLSQCDMKCKLCYASKDTGKLPLEQAQQIIDFFRRISANRISLTGGEALVHPQVNEIVKYAHQVGFKVNPFTRGSLLNFSSIYPLVNSIY